MQKHDPEGQASERRVSRSGRAGSRASPVAFRFFVVGIFVPHLHGLDSLEKVVTGAGQTVFTTEDITAGQVTLEARGLTPYGSIC